ncbi:MAG: hypothetical protein Q8S33_13365 [Myxococcales bacterium]|nr:hypothetical protein [Myxococcales bacterium]MDP3501328.1 hypothetical protein [Myxococcales bacterium]
MLSVLAAIVLSGSPSTGPRRPVAEWLSAKAGLEQLTPGDWVELVETPDSIALEGLRDATPPGKAPFGTSETKFTVAWKKTLERPADVSSVLTLFRTGSQWKVRNQEGCAPGRCVTVMLCGGFRPVLAITLTKGDRAMRVLVCFDCEEAWLQRFTSKEMTAKDEAASEQVLLGDKKAWLAVFAPLVPDGDVIQRLAAEVSKTKPRPH